MKNLYLLILLLSIKTIAQIPTIDNTFNTNDNGNYEQYIGANSALLPDGKLLSIYGLRKGTSWKIVRLNQDGSIDNTFSFTDQCGFYTKIITTLDGNFFTISNGNIKRYKNDGVLDATFTAPVFIGSARYLISQNDGKIIVVGDFSKINNIDCYNIARLNNDGSIDNTFSLAYNFSGSYNGSPYYINTVAIQSNGKYIVGGEFPSINNYNGRIRRLNSDGTNDNTFNVYSTYVANLGLNSPLEGFDGKINNIKVQTDGKIIVSGGNFRSNGSIKSKEIVRLNSNGTWDTSFSLNLGNSPIFWANEILSFVIQNDGKYLVTTDINKVYRLNLNGSVDTAFSDTNIGQSIEDNGGVFIQNNKIIVNSNYKTTSGITRFGIFRLNVDGTLDLNFNPHSGTNFLYSNESYLYNNAGNNYNLHNTKVLLDGKILIVGNFTSYNDNGCKYICKLTQDGQFDPSFNLDSSVKIDVFPGSQYDLSTIIKQQNNGKIFISGLGPGNYNNTTIKLTVNGIQKNLVKIDENGILDNSFNFNEEGNNIIDYKIQSDGKILIIGSGPLFMVNTKYKIIRLNTDGSIDTSFTSLLFYKNISSLEIQSDNKILVCGNLLNYDENNVLHRLNQDGSKDNSFNNIVFYNYSKLQENGKILVVYRYSVFYPSYLRRLNSDGTKDTSFNEIGTPENFQQIFITSSGNIVLSTYTGTINNQPINNQFFMFDQNGVFKNSFGQKYYKSQTVQQNCDYLIVSGYFDKIDGVKKNNMVRYSLTNSVTPPAPTGNLSQTFTVGQTLSNLVVNGQNIQWYNTPNLCASNNTTNKIKNINAVLPTNTLLVNGTTYFATQTINGIESNYRLPITVTKTLDTKDYVLENLSVFPVPIQDFLTISNNSAINSVDVYNLSGQIIFSKKYNSNVVKIDFSSFDSGVYLAKVYSDNNMKSVKIVKK